MSDNEDNLEITLRSLVWMGDSRKNIREFPLIRAKIGRVCAAISASRGNTNGS
jgi:hypothetical protein